MCTDAHSNKSIHGRCSSAGLSNFSRNWTKENMESVDCQCDSVKFKWTSSSTGPCGRTALVFTPKMSWQNEGPCNMGLPELRLCLLYLPAPASSSPFTDQPVALTGIIPVHTCAQTEHNSQNVDIDESNTRLCAKNKAVRYVAKFRLCLRQDGWPARWPFLPAPRCVLVDLREPREEPPRLRKRPLHVPAVEPIFSV